MAESEQPTFMAASETEAAGPLPHMGMMVHAYVTDPTGKGLCGFVFIEGYSIPRTRTSDLTLVMITPQRNLFRPNVKHNAHPETQGLRIAAMDATWHWPEECPWDR